MESYEIRKLVGQIVIRGVAVINLSPYNFGICTLWSSWWIGSIFKVIITVFAVKVHHKKSSDLVTGFFLWRLEFLVLDWPRLISESDVVSLVDFSHSRDIVGETLCWKVAKIWQTICEVTRYLPNLLWWRPCLVNNCLSLIESRNLVCGNILTNFCSFLFNIKILFTAEWLGKSNLYGIFNNRMFV